MIRKRVISGILILLLIISPLYVEAKSNPYKSYWRIVDGTRVSNCIYVAWDEAKRHTGVELPYWGAAGRKEETSWLAKAKKAGYETGKVAKANSIAVYEGHVAYVLSVSKDGKYMYTNQGGIYSRKVNKETGETYIVPKNGTGTAFNYKVSAKVGPKSWGNLELFGFIYLEPIEGFMESTTTKVGDSIPDFCDFVTKTTISFPSPTEYITTTELITTRLTFERTTTPTTTGKMARIEIKKKKDLAFYESICSILALIILALLIITTYIYKKCEKK